MEVHDLHVWSISLDKPALSVHVQTDSQNTDNLLRRLQHLLATKFRVHHSTIQIEQACALPGDDDLDFEPELRADNNGLDLELTSLKTAERGLDVLKAADQGLDQPVQLNDFQESEGT